MVPIVISHLGLGGYGIWSIILVAAAYMRFGSAGIKSAFQKYVAEATATGNFETTSELLSTGAVSMLAISIAGLVPLIIFSHQVARLAGVPTQYVNAAAGSIVILSCTYALANFGSAFESIVMGGQRIDLTRIYVTVLSVLEAVGIVILLHFGAGLVGMTLVIGCSELIYILCCYKASRRVIPSIKVSLAKFKLHVLPELIRYGGSYQLVNILEIVYQSILPIVCLKYFGADTAGIYAVAARVTNSCLVAQNALVLPILSGGALVFASGTAERARAFVTKAFRATLATALPPIGFACIFGSMFVFAWTGQAGPRFSAAIWFVSIAGLLQAVSLLQLVLYRAVGGVFLDNIRQIVRVCAILAVGVFASSIGFQGMLVAIVGAELLGVILMSLAILRTFPNFDARSVTWDALKICAVTGVMISTGAAVGILPVPWVMAERLVVTAKLAEIGAGGAVAALPALLITKLVSMGDIRALLFSLIPNRAPLTSTLG